MQNITLKCKKQIYLFTHAGGTISFFDELIPQLKPYFDVYSFEYAGHGTRFAEKQHNTIQDAILDASLFMKNHRNNEPYYIFAYSMGCVIAQKVLDLYFNDDLPLKVFMASHVPPHVMNFSSNPMELDDEVFLKTYVVPLGGINDEIANNRIFRRLHLPILKNDYYLLFDSARYAGINPLDVELYIMYSNDDVHCVRMDEWCQYTKLNKIHVYFFEGGHFFLKQHVDEVAEIIINS